MDRLKVLCVGLLAVAAGLVVAGQASNQLVGTWERSMLTNAKGSMTDTPGFLIFTENGHFTLIAIPSDRPKSSKTLREMTREELLARFEGVQVRRGTYTISRNRVTRKDAWNIDPNREGSEQVQEFSIRDDELILRTPGTQQEARFRKVK